MKKLIKMKVYQQETEYTCGGAVIMTLLDFYGKLKGRTEKEISKKLGTRFKEPHPGTHPNKMLRFLRNEKMQVDYGENKDLKFIYKHIDKKIPVIILDSTWNGHWRMIIGYKKGYLPNECGVFIAEPAYEDMKKGRTKIKGIIFENEKRFIAKWYENCLFERTRRHFYITAYPKDKKSKRAENAK